MTKENVLYEIGYMLKSNLSSEDILAFSNKIRDSIMAKKGLVNSEGQPKNISLAYEINKETAAVFNWLKFTLNSDQLEELEKELKKDPSVIRFLMMKIKKDEPVKIPILKLRRERETEKITKTETIETSAATEEKEKIKEEEIDKKIEELLGE